MKIIQRLEIALVYFFFITFLIPQTEAAGDSWTTKAPILTARRDVGRAVADGKSMQSEGETSATLPRTKNISPQQIFGPPKLNANPQIRRRHIRI